MEGPIMKKPCAVLSVALLAPLAFSSASAAVPPWQDSEGASRVCGGVGLEEFAELRAQRGTASAELLFTAGERGGYLSDVEVTVRGRPLAQALQWTTEGPLCLLKLPRGSYVVEANYGGVRQTRKLVVGRSVSTLQFRYPVLE
jgi:hypothetical protein